jgi:sulfur-oxidizing protein SoxX
MKPSCPASIRWMSGKDVREESVGKTILTAQQVEDVVAYLGTLKE